MHERVMMMEGVEDRSDGTTHNWHYDCRNAHTKGICRPHSQNRPVYTGRTGICRYTRTRNEESCQICSDKDKYIPADASLDKTIY